MKDKTVFKTDYRRKKEARELEIYNEWNALTSVAGSMATSVTEHIMAKHKIASASSIWSIRKRVKKRLKAEKQNEN